MKSDDDSSHHVGPRDRTRVVRCEAISLTLLSAFFSLLRVVSIKTLLLDVKGRE